MYCPVDTAKSFDHASTDLESSVQRHGFGVLHVHDLGTRRGNGFAFDTEKGRIRIGLINPVNMLSALSGDAALIRVAEEVEEATMPDGRRGAMNRRPES